MYAKFLKRIFDFIFSLTAFIILLPIFLVLILIGTIAMNGNPFFTQLRPGKRKRNGEDRIFKLIKFRTMSNKKDKDGNLLPDEQRLNKYGKLLRATSLDELPELINILVGHMSIIGPRPLLVEYLPWYTKEEKHRHDVRPGLTGWAQVNGRNTVAWDERFQMDLEYIRNVSLWFDIKIFFLTIKKVLKREGIASSTGKYETNMAKERASKAEDEKTENQSLG